MPEKESGVGYRVPVTADLHHSRDRLVNTTNDYANITILYVDYLE